MPVRECRSKHNQHPRRPFAVADATTWRIFFWSARREKPGCARTRAKQPCPWIDGSILGMRNGLAWGSIPGARGQPEVEWGPAVGGNCVDGLLAPHLGTSTPAELLDGSRIWIRCRFRGFVSYLLPLLRLVITRVAPR